MARKTTTQAKTAKEKKTADTTSKSSRTAKNTDTPKEKPQKQRTTVQKDSTRIQEKKPLPDKNADVKFPDFQKRNVAGENVSVKKIGEFGMLVIHYPTSKISDILLSAWNEKGETVFYRKALKATRVTAVQEQIAAAEKLLQTAAK